MAAFNIVRSFPLLPSPAGTSVECRSIPSIDPGACARAVRQGKRVRTPVELADLRIEAGIRRD